MTCFKKQIKIALIFLLFASIPLLETRADSGDQPVTVTWQHYAYEDQDHYYPATLTFALQPGWKLYAPFGDYADSAPQLDWQSQNVTAIDLLWPNPEKIETQDATIFGYNKTLELPLKIVTKDPTQASSLAMTLRYVACNDKQCVPLETIIQGAIDPKSTSMAGKQLLASYSKNTQDSQPLPVKNKTDFNILTVLMWAFVGGFILNFMPCVLPVLSLKLMTVLRFHGKEKQHVRRGFLLSTLGILAAFFVLSLVFAGLKSMGTSIGWGLHFQNPYFLIGLVLVISFFLFNVLGLWQFRQPQLTTGHKEGWSRDFLEGVLVMILATPCTAPFVGAALGIALSQPWPTMTLILLTLALGLASPYLLVALFPSVVAFLPKPGSWMQKVKWIMAIGLGLTVAWLLYVLHAHIGNIGIGVILGLLAAIGILLWQGKRLPSKMIQTSGVVVLSLVLFCTPLWWHKTSSSLLNIPIENPKNKIASPTAPSGSIVKKGEWLPFDPDMINKLVAEDKIVFVDVTADWCLLCQVNKQKVMSDPKFQRYFDEGKIVPMRADWTNREDNRIITYLQSFQRYGIPFNAIYGPNAKEGIPLSEWLTLEEIEEAYQQALPKRSALDIISFRIK